MAPIKPIMGKKIIYLVQGVNDTNGAKLPGIPVDGTYGSEKELFDEQTKVGRIVDVAGRSDSVELTLYAVQDDEGLQMFDDAYENDEDLKVWRVNLNKNGNDAYDAHFGYGVIESRELSDESEGAVEISTTLQIRGKMIKDELTSIPQEILDLVDAIQYQFEEPDETGAGV